MNFSEKYTPSKALEEFCLHDCGAYLNYEDLKDCRSKCEKYKSLQETINDYSKLKKAFNRICKKYGEEPDGYCPRDRNCPKLRDCSKCLKEWALKGKLKCKQD